MAQFDFIPNNGDTDRTDAVELICKAFLTKRTWYDGRNPYAPKEDVVLIDGQYTFSSKDGKHIFTPTAEDIRKALDVFKSKGYHPYYDNDVCYYGYAKRREDIWGDWRIRHTVWL